MDDDDDGGGGGVAVGVIRTFLTMAGLMGPAISLSLATLDAVGRMKLSADAAPLFRTGAGELGTATSEMMIIIVIIIIIIRRRRRRRRRKIN